MTQTTTMTVMVTSLRPAGVLVEASEETETMGAQAEEVGQAEEEPPNRTMMRDHVHRRPSLDVPARYGARLAVPSRLNSLSGMSPGGRARATVG